MKYRISYIAIIAFCLFPRLLFAESLIPFPEGLEITGYVENESAYRLKSPKRFSKIQNNLELKAEYDVTDNLEFYTRGQFSYDAAYDVETAYRGIPAQEYRLNWDSGQMIREMYLEYFFEDVSVTLGKQQVVWGEATGLKITDIVNPTDLSEFILDDFLDSRIGLWMAKVNYVFGDSQLEAVVIPDFEGNRTAVAGSEWAIGLPEYFNGFFPVLNETKKPSDGLQNSDVGFRFNTIMNSWDVSLYYFYSWDDTATYHTFTTGLLKTISPEHHRLHTAGGTFNYAVGKTVYSGEMALYFDKYFQNSNPNDIDAVDKKNYLHYMLGAEYSASSWLAISGQMVQKVVMGNTQYLRDDPVSTTFTLMLQTDFLNETLKPDLLIFYGANDGDWLLRPKVTYAWDDNIKLTAGIDVFSGSKTSLLGQFSSNNRAFTEIKYSF